MAVNPRVWDYKAMAIASIDRLKRKEHKRILLENRKWDLIIFDEAHRLSAIDYGSGKTEKTQNYRLAEEIRLPDYSEAFLLLTATPHQGEENHSRFKNLLRLLDDDIDFSGLDEQLPLFPAGGGGRKFTDLVIRTPKKDVTDAEGHKVFKGRQTHRLPVKMYDDEKEFYNAVAEYIRDGYQDAGARQRRDAATGGGLPADDISEAQRQLDGRDQGCPARTAHAAAGRNLRPARQDEDERSRRAVRRGAWRNKSCSQNDREIMQDEILALEQLLAMPVKRDKKLDELLGLIDHIAKESGRCDEEKVLIFTEYRQTQRYLVLELGEEVREGLRRRNPRRHEAGAAGGRPAATSNRSGRRLPKMGPSLRRPPSGPASGCSAISRRSAFWFRPRPAAKASTSSSATSASITTCPGTRCASSSAWAGSIASAKTRWCRSTTSSTRARSKRRSKPTSRTGWSYAARAIAKVTGEDPEEIKGRLNGQLESEIDPTEIYQRALVEGNLNKQTQKEIDEAVKRAKQAYEIATQSLFRDCSSYSFDNYQRQLATDLTLADLQRFTERFLGEHRRQLQKKEALFEFIVPDVLGPCEASGAVSTQQRSTATWRFTGATRNSWRWAIRWWTPCCNMQGRTASAGLTALSASTIPG